MSPTGSRDTLTLHDKEGNPTDIAPLKVELVPEGANNGSPLVAEEPVLNSAVISTEQYAAAGHPGEDTGLYETDGSAPALTRYKVTAYYARENFKLDFWDPQVEDGATYQVKMTSQSITLWQMSTEAETDLRFRMMPGVITSSWREAAPSG